MPKFLSQIDAFRIPIKGLVPEQVSAFPGSPVEGQVVHRTDLKQTYQYLNASWVRMDAGGSASLTHTHVIGDVTGLQTALDSKAATTTTVTAGTGLTGGGALSANISLAVSFGTGSTQALAGNTRLDQIAVPTASVSLNNQKITNLAAPTVGTDAVTKTYVDNLVTGFTANDAVRVATTANITLSGTQTIDGVAVVAGNRVLVKNQTTASQNGVYLASAGAWTRAADQIKAGSFVFVQEGTTQADTGWLISTDGAITVDTTSVAYVQFSGGGSVVAGSGLTQTGTTLNVIGTANRITANADSIDIASTYAGQSSITTLGTVSTGVWQGTAVGIAYGGTGATTSAAARTALSATGKYTGLVGALTAGVWANVTHSLGATDVVASLIDEATGEAVVMDWKRVDANTIAVRSDVAVAANATRVVVVG